MTFSSREVKVRSIFSFRFTPMTASVGEIAERSSMNSPTSVR
jgi:hypothetical protein